MNDDYRYCVENDHEDDDDEEEAPAASGPVCDPVQCLPPSD